jgi:hypothetical protein
VRVRYLRLPEGRREVEPLQTRSHNQGGCCPLSCATKVANAANKREKAAQSCSHQSRIASIPPERQFARLRTAINAIEPAHKVQFSLGERAN